MSRKELTVKIWEIGWLPLAIRQPEREGSFGTPLTDTQIDYSNGWQPEEIVTSQPVNNVFGNDGKHLTEAQVKAAVKANFDVMLAELAKIDRVVIGTTAEHDAEGNLVTIGKSGAELATEIRKLAEKHHFPQNIKTVGVTCNRRGYKLWVGALAYCQNAPADSPRKLSDFVIPCHEHTFANLTEQKDAVWAENDAANKKAEYTFAGDVERCLFYIADSLRNESDCMAKFGWPRGKAQKVFGVAKLIERFPKLRILERLRLDPPKAIDVPGKGKRIPYQPLAIKDGVVVSGYLPDRTLDAGDVGILLGRKPKSDSRKALAKQVFGENLDDEGRQPDGTKVWQPELRATQEQVEEYFRLVMGFAKPAALPSNKLKELADKVPSLGSFVEAVRAGNGEDSLRLAKQLGETLDSASKAQAEVEQLRARVKELESEVSALQKQNDALRSKAKQPAGKGK